MEKKCKQQPVLEIGISCKLSIMGSISQRIDAIIAKKRDQVHRSGSTKVSALTMLRSGASPITVSKALGIPRRTLQRWRKASIKAGTFGADGDGGLARPAPRKADPGTGTKNRKMTEELKKKVKKELGRNPFLTPFGLQKVIPGLRSISKRTIRRCIQVELKIPSRLAAKKPNLTEAQKARRLSWADRHRRWSRVKWAKVLWSDETHVEQWQGAQQSRRVRWSSSFSRYDPNFILRTVKFPPKLMIWGCFGNSQLGDLYFVEANAKMNAEMYKQVLRRHLKRSLQKTGCSVFMQDGAPCHKARSIMTWLADHDVSMLEWVGQSCDCNPIENLWDKLKSIIRKYDAPSNLNELAKNIQRGWRELGRNTAYLAKLTYSMQNRVNAVIEASGDVTKY